MSGDQVRRLKELEKENERLRRGESDLTLDKQILAEAACGNVFSIRGVRINAPFRTSSTSAIPLKGVPQPLQEGTQHPVRLATHPGACRRRFPRLRAFNRDGEIGLHGLPLGQQGADNHRVDDPHDLVAVGVVRAELRALVRVEPTLEQGAEDISGAAAAQTAGCGPPVAAATARGTSLPGPPEKAEEQRMKAVRLSRNLIVVIALVVSLGANVTLFVGGVVYSVVDEFVDRAFGLTTAAATQRRALAALKKKNVDLQTANRKLRGQLGNVRHVVASAAERSRTRLLRSAKRSVATLPGKALPYAGAAVVAAVTAMEIKDLCARLNSRIVGAMVELSLRSGRWITSGFGSGSRMLMS